jgi:hypothetical protein
MMYAVRSGASSKAAETMKVEAMLWVLVLASLALAIVSRKYRKYGLAVVGIAVLAIVAIVALVRKDETWAPPSTSTPAQMKRVDFEQSHVEKLDKEDPEAKNRIGVSEIRFDQVRPYEEWQPGTFESIHARLYNDSARFTLTDYAYYLEVQDCVARVCTTIYDQRGLASALVPPHQARDIAIEIRGAETRGLPRFKLRGTPNIVLSPSATRAYKTDLIP